VNISAVFIFRVDVNRERMHLDYKGNVARRVICLDTEAGCSIFLRNVGIHLHHCQTVAIQKIIK
jgi:hypothetical protein